MYGSQGRMILFIEGSNEKYTPLTWQSRKLRRVVKSTLILNLNVENQILPIKCITDSKSLHDVVYSSNNPTEKRLGTELCSIQESLEKGEIQHIKWVNSKDQLADCLTKKKHPVKRCS